MHCSVLRGLFERDLSSVNQVSLDEKSFSKGHRYISVLSDSKTGTVLDIIKERTQEAVHKL